MVWKELGVVYHMYIDVMVGACLNRKHLNKKSDVGMRFEQLAVAKNKH